MPAEINMGEFAFGAGPTARGAPVSPAAPFHICVIGDFGGTHNGDASRRGPVEIDRDNFEDVLDRLNVVFACEMPAGQPRAAIRFRSLDDFHPDQLYEAIETFETLRRLRRQLLNAQTFAAAADEVRTWLPEAVTIAAPVPDTAAAPAAEPIDAAHLLEGILETADAAADERPEGIDWNAVIREIVRPYSIPAVDPQQGVLVDCVNAMIGRTMTVLLHHPRLRALESAWRGLWFLVRRLETDSRLKVFLLDASRTDLRAELDGGEQPQFRRLQHELVEKTVGTPGAQPWAVLLGLDEFSPGDSDAQLLSRYASLAQAAGAPFIAAATDAVPGALSGNPQSDPEDWRPAEATEAWQELRADSAAKSVCLIWPSFLLRLPYGPKTSPTEAFDYQEIPGVPQQTDYLWGNPALIAGCLLGQSYSESGWGLRIGEQSEVSGLPLHVYDDDGEQIARPCATVQLTETGGRHVAACGLTSLWSVREQDVVQLPDLKSLAGGELAGRWS